MLVSGRIYIYIPLDPKTHGKMKVFNPQYMDEITPKNEGCTWVPMVYICPNSLPGFVMGPRPRRLDPWGQSPPGFAVPCSTKLPRLRRVRGAKLARNTSCGFGVVTHGFSHGKLGRGPKT